MNNTNIRARLAGGNVKLGNIATFSKLYGDQVHTSARFGDVVGSCGNHCEGCRSACYVRKSYRYPSVIDGHARNTLAMRQDMAQAFGDLDGQLSRKRRPFEVVRIHQSGEIENAAELFGWLMLAKKHPESRFYIYTKNFEAVAALEKSIAAGFEVSGNFTLLVSVWHGFGLEEFKRLSALPFVKAFAYCDGFDYEAAGLHIETMCKAYDGGKLNHAITCDKCKKCFNSAFKVIGCEDH